MSSVAPIPASRADTGVGRWDWTKPHPSASYGPTLLFSLSYPFSHLPFLHIFRLPTPSFAPSSLYLPPVFPWISFLWLPASYILSPFLSLAFPRLLFIFILFSLLSVPPPASSFLLFFLPSFPRLFPIPFPSALLLPFCSPPPLKFRALGQ